MAECSIASVDVLNNPAAFTDPIILEVQYTCLSSLKEDLEWKIIYVGSAESDDYDQVLDSALVGPVNPGQFKFRMEAPAPDSSRYVTLKKLTVLHCTHSRALKRSSHTKAAGTCSSGKMASLSFLATQLPKAAAAQHLFYNTA